MNNSFTVNGEKFLSFEQYQEVMARRNNPLNAIKSSLLAKGWGNAIELLNCIAKHKPEALAEWLKTKSTITLMQAAESFRNWSIYNQRSESLAFDNDVYALDAVICNGEAAQ